MKNQKKTISRTVYKVDEIEVSKLLIAIAEQSIIELNHMEAVKWAKKIFYAVKGNIKRPIDGEEASKLIKRGYH